MKIEIEVPESVIREAAVRAWQQSFVSPSYHGSGGGEGYRIVAEEVRKHILELPAMDETRNEIKSVAAQLAPSIVREIVTEELRKLVKRVVKQEKDGNTLLSDTTVPSLFPDVKP